MSIDASSFANAAGGTIIYGITEENHVAAGIAGLDPNKPTKETLEQWIQGNVRPRIEGLRIDVVPLPSRSSEEVAYVVHVPAGTTAHQAGDGKFHRRDNFGCHMMHYDEIMDVMNRPRGPDLRLEFAVTGEARLIWNPPEEQSEPIMLTIRCVNHGRPALYSLQMLYLEAPDAIWSIPRSEGFDPEQVQRMPPGATLPGYPYISFSKKRCVPDQPPIFPGFPVSLGTMFLRFASSVQGGGEIGFANRRRMYWECIAVDMAIRRGGAVLLYERGMLSIMEIPRDEVETWFLGAQAGAALTDRE